MKIFIAAMLGAAAAGFVVTLFVVYVTS